MIVYSPMGSGLLTGAMTRERIAQPARGRLAQARRALPASRSCREHLALVERLRGGRRPPRHDAGRGRGRLDAAQPGGRRRDRRLPPPRPGRPDHRRGDTSSSATTTSRRSKGGHEMATDTQPTAIGFVGLGHMGGNMAARFLAAGYAVYGEERNREHARRARRSDGLQWRDTPREVAEAADDRLHVAPRRRRARGGRLGPGRDPRRPRRRQDLGRHEHGQPAREPRARRARARAAERRCSTRRCRAASPRCRAGTLTIMVGGDEQAYARVEPILRELGTPTHIGENGQGLVLKLAINISLAVQMLAFSEGLLLAERAGIDRELAARGDDREPDRLADAEGARPARPRPARRGLVRRRADAEGHRARARRRPAARRPAAVRGGGRRDAHRRPSDSATSTATSRRSSRCWPTCRPTVKNHELHDHCGLPW